MGDQISVGSMTGVQGIAIGRNAQAVVTGHNISGEVRIDAGELRAVLGDLYDDLGALEVPRDARIAAQRAAGDAISAVSDDDVEAATVTSNLEKVGQALMTADAVIEKGTSMWDHVARLSSLLGPLVGGAKVVSAWFGIPLP
jgi:uncharacterized protein (UPF0147 family)